MVRHLRIHRAHHGDVVGELRGAGEDLADFEAALAVGLELEGRGKRRAGLAFGAEVFVGQLLTGVFCERGLGVERVHMRRPAVEEEVDDALGPPGEVRSLRRERAHRLRRARRRQQAREAHRAHAHAAAREEITTIEHWTRMAKDWELHARTIAKRASGTTAFMRQAGLGQCSEPNRWDHVRLNAILAPAMMPASAQRRPTMPMAASHASSRG